MDNRYCGNITIKAGSPQKKPTPPPKPKPLIAQPSNSSKEIIKPLEEPREKLVETVEELVAGRATSENDDDMDLCLSDDDTVILDKIKSVPSSKCSEDTIGLELECAMPSNEKKRPIDDDTTTDASASAISKMLKLDKVLSSTKNQIEPEEKCMKWLETKFDDCDEDADPLGPLQLTNKTVNDSFMLLADYSAELLEEKSLKSSDTLTRKFSILFGDDEEDEEELCVKADISIKEHGVGELLFELVEELLITPPGNEQATTSTESDEGQQATIGAPVVLQEDQFDFLSFNRIDDMEKTVDQMIEEVTNMSQSSVLNESTTEKEKKTQTKAKDTKIDKKSSGSRVTRNINSPYTNVIHYQDFSDMFDYHIAHCITMDNIVNLVILKNKQFGIDMYKTNQELTNTISIDLLTRISSTIAEYLVERYIPSFRCKLLLRCLHKNIVEKYGGANVELGHIAKCLYQIVLNMISNNKFLDGFLSTFCKQILQISQEYLISAPPSTSKSASFSNLPENGEF